MKFGDALEAMKRGRPIRRANWPGTWCLQIGGGKVRHYPKRGNVAPLAHLGTHDLLADDWELLNQPLSATEGEPLGGIQNRTLAEVDGIAA